MLLAAWTTVSLVAVLACAGVWVLSGRGARAAELQASAAAYLDGDCRLAVARFEAGTRDLALGSPPAPSQAHRVAVEQCRTLLRVTGNDADRLRSYAELSGSVARTPGRAALRALVAGSLTSGLARKPKRPVCDALLSLRTDAMLPAPQGRVADLFVACGKLLGRSDKADDAFDALQLYRDVRVAEPRPRAAAAAFTAEAALRIRRARESGLQLDPSTPDRDSAGRISIVTVRNDTPATLYVAIAGRKLSRVVEIPPCAECGRQPRNADHTCRRSSPHLSVTLPRGRYQVAWELDQPGEHWRTAVTTWDLTKGGRYTDCHWIAERRTD